MQFKLLGQRIEELGAYKTKCQTGNGLQWQRKIPHELYSFMLHYVLTGSSYRPMLDVDESEDKVKPACQEY